MVYNFRTGDKVLIKIGAHRGKLAEVVEDPPKNATYIFIKLLEEDTSLRCYDKYLDHVFYDYSSIINFALDTDDQEWFNQLWNKSNAQFERMFITEG